LQIATAKNTVQKLQSDYFSWKMNGYVRNSEIERVCVRKLARAKSRETCIDREEHTETIWKRAKFSCSCGKFVFREIPYWEMKEEEEEQEEESNNFITITFIIIIT